MLITITCALILALGLGLSALLLFAKLRGVLHYWIRPYEQAEFWALGREIPADSSPETASEILAEANAALRSQEERSSQVIRQWDHEQNTLFLGVVLPRKLALDEANFQLRHFPAAPVLRISGQNRADERSPLTAAREFARTEELSPDFTRPVRLSGQSFELYQWPLPAASPAPISPARKLLESLAQLRDNLTLPILLGLISIGLLGMRDPILFAAGISFIVLLSGACKFVLIHQNQDEADERHLQNY
ncbi:MAG: hypothetical protein ACQKBY_07140 [Verrucomicrobiales bacterium]